jgi:hypothetical protein
MKLLLSSTGKSSLPSRIPRALATFILLAALSSIASAQLTNIQYTTASDGNGGLIITGFSANGSGPLTIPSSINGLTVTQIGANGGPTIFGRTALVTDVTIPNSVTLIGDNSFSSCVTLTSVAIPTSVTTIGSSAFQDCESLTSVTIPEGVTLLKNYAFAYCYSLTSLTLPASLTSIPDYAFTVTSLVTLNIPDTVTSIGYCSFGECPSLTAVTIPSSVTSISFGAWEACQNLTSFTVSAQNTSFSSVNGVLFDKSQSTLIAYPPGKTDTTFTIPESVTAIFAEAFFYCQNLVSITISPAISTINYQTFARCGSLASITIPPSVTSIGNDAFAGCGSLTNVNIPSSVTNIGSGVFAACGDLANINIPTSVTTIGDGAFENCTDLASITLPFSVTNIADSTFSGCTDLTNVSIPRSVTEIGEDAFYSCTSLISITIPASVRAISDGAFDNCTSLTSASFLGNAPVMGPNALPIAPANVTVNYVLSATGFTTPIWTDSAFDMYPAYPTLPKPSFSDWQNSYNVTGAAADVPLNDGVPNLLKYFYDINPTAPLTTTDRAALPQFAMTTASGGAPELTLTYRQLSTKTGLSVHVQTSSDLKTWTTDTTPADQPQPTGTLDPNTGDPIMRVTVPASGPVAFLRLSITSP